MDGLTEVLKTRRVVVCVGSGGVGKTSTSAALALYGAMQGMRVLCLTIDPARRLANSLGLEEMRTDEQEVPAELFAQHGMECPGSLWAMMLNTKRTFEELVERHSSSEEARDRILNNRVYQYVSGSLAGTQEYMAMEKLHAVRQESEWDLIVLDTPPTSNALDFLDAPDRLVDAIDSPAMRWFTQAFESSGEMSLNLVGRGAAFLLKGLSKFTGVEFLEQVAEFVSSLNDLFGGFRERAREVSQALRSSEVAFVVVTSASPLAIAEALAFDRRLKESKMASEALIVNRVHRALEAASHSSAEFQQLVGEALPTGIDVSSAARKLQRAHDDEQIRARADRAEVDRLRALVGEETTFVEIPAFEEDVHDLTGLRAMAGFLAGAPIQA